MLALYVVLIFGFLKHAFAENHTIAEIKSPPDCALPCIFQAAFAYPEVYQNLQVYCTDDSLKKSLATCLLSNSTCTEIQLTNLYSDNEDLCDGYTVPDRSGTLITVVAVLCVLSIIFVSLRFYSRARIIKNIGLDDWFILAALLPGIALTAVALHAIPLGYGRHIWDIPLDNLHEMILDLTICVILLIITTGLTKISILLFYLRIFPHQTFRRVCYALVGFVTAWTITFTFVQIFQCNPIHKAWDHTVPGTCANNGIIIFAQAILSVFQDIFIIILPLPLFLRLKVSRQKKWGVVLMFGLGIISTISLVTRIAYSAIFAISGDIDASWGGLNILIWGAVEFNAGIICASLPGARPVFCKLMPSVFGSLNSSYTDASSNQEIKSWQPSSSNAEEKGVVPQRQSRIRSAHSIIEREIAALESGSESDIDGIHEEPRLSLVMTKNETSTKNET